MFCVVFAAFSFSWNEEAALVAMEIVLNYPNYSLSSKFEEVANLISEKFEHLSYIGIWLQYIKRAPYNTDCFEHWRYIQMPLNAEKFKHNDADNLNATLDNLFKSIYTKKLNGNWAYNFGFKVFISLFLDAFDPVHTTEFFSNDFTEGDDNAKLFKVLYKGEEYSLHDFRESGCGLWTGSHPFTDEQVSNIVNKAKEIISEYQPSIYLRRAMTNVTQIIYDSHNKSYTEVYSNLTLVPGAELSDEYVNRCQKFSKERIAIAAYSLAYFLFLVSIPQREETKQQISQAYVSGYITMCFMVPFTVMSLYFFIKRIKKTDTIPC